MDKIKIVGLICIGIVIGILLSMVYVSLSLDLILNSILENINIENVNFDLNETKLVEEMNNAFGVNE